MPSQAESYSVEKQIGRGAFGMAYLALHKATGTRCVLKKVKLARQSAKERQCTIRELELLSNLRHRNVLMFMDAWVEAGCVACMAVELCNNGDLMSQLKIRVPQQLFFHERHLHEMLAQLASGLSYLHQNNIAHRDVKSSNIFVTESGCLRLADFGLATILDVSEPLSSTMVGTPNYMCPEMLKEQPYGIKNDIWALGCVMYELSALKPAFQAFNMDGLVKKITSGPTPLLPSHYSDDWKAVVRAMLSKDEDQRPSADDILRLPWLQPAIESVAAQFGPSLPDGAEAFVVIEQLPEPIAQLAEQFRQQERDAEVRAAEEMVYRKEQQAKFAPRALRQRAEMEKAEAVKAAAAVRAKMDRLNEKAEPLRRGVKAAVPRLALPIQAAVAAPVSPRRPRAASGQPHAGAAPSSPRCTKSAAGQGTPPSSPRLSSSALSPRSRDSLAGGGPTNGPTGGRRASVSGAPAAPSLPCRAPPTVGCKAGPVLSKAQSAKQLQPPPARPAGAAAAAPAPPAATRIPRPLGGVATRAGAAVPSVAPLAKEAGSVRGRRPSIPDVAMSSEEEEITVPVSSFSVSSCQGGGPSGETCEHPRTALPPRPRAGSNGRPLMPPPVEPERGAPGKPAIRASSSPPRREAWGTCQPAASEPPAEVLPGRPVARRLTE